MGVCSGLADFLNWKTRNLRILFVIGMILGIGTPFFLYLFCAIIMMINEAKIERKK